jgi:hypothetical protein
MEASIARPRDANPWREASSVVSLVDLAPILLLGSLLYLVHRVMSPAAPGQRRGERRFPAWSYALSFGRCRACDS